MMRVRETTTDLSAWLLEQIADDERRAKGARLPGRPEGWVVDDEPWEVSGIGIVDDANDSVAVAVGPRVAEHIAAWDPARVLAECDAKRRIIEVHHAREATGFDRDGEEHSAMVCDACSMEDDPCPTLRLFSLPYADRPGYREEWRP